MTIIHSKNYSFRKKWELFIQKIIQLEKNYSNKYPFKKFENYSFKKIIIFFEKLIIAQGWLQALHTPESARAMVWVASANWKNWLAEPAWLGRMTEGSLTTHVITWFIQMFQVLHYRFWQEVGALSKSWLQRWTFVTISENQLRVT